MYSVIPLTLNYSLVAVVIFTGTRWYRGANICATVLVLRILFRLLRSIALPDKYGMERIEMVYRGFVWLGCVANHGRALRNCANKLYENSI